MTIKHGAAPFLECSSRGDKRFSAFYARIKARGNQSIEELYQAFKIFPDGETNLHWREAKGRQPVNAVAAAKFYGELWVEYIKENPHLLTVLREYNGYSDFYGQPGRQCQATELWKISNNFYPDMFTNQF